MKALALSALTTLALALAAAGGGAQDVQERVDRILDRIEESKGAGLWDGIRELDELGRGAIEPARKSLTRADANARVAAAKYLYGQAPRGEAPDALAKVVGGKNAPARRVAADMIATLVSTDKGLPEKDRRRITADLEKQAAEATDPLAQVALWRATWSLSQSIKPVREVRALYASAEKRDVKEEAALVLAEMDRFSDARATLLELAEQPGERGRMARAYKKIYELSEEMRRNAGQGGASKYDFKQLEEAIDTLKANYYDESKIDPKKLIDNAVRGACASLDSFTTYMDE